MIRWHIKKRETQWAQWTRWKTIMTVDTVGQIHRWALWGTWDAWSRLDTVGHSGKTVYTVGTMGHRINLETIHFSCLAVFYNTYIINIYFENHMFSVYYNMYIHSVLVAFLTSNQSVLYTVCIYMKIYTVASRRYLSYCSGMNASPNRYLVSLSFSISFPLFLTLSLQL